MTSEQEKKLKQMAEEQGQIGQASAHVMCAGESFPLRARLENQRCNLLSALRRLDNQIAFVQEHPEIEGLGFGLSNQIGC